MNIINIIKHKKTRLETVGKNFGFVTFVITKFCFRYSLCILSKKDVSRFD